MRERLIELMKKNYVSSALITESLLKYWEELADMLLDEGVIVPPVTIGQKVYIIGWCNDVEEFVVRDVRLFTNDKGDSSYSFRAVMRSTSYIHFMDYYIGSTVFLTKAEAEKALAEREGEE